MASHALRYPSSTDGIRLGASVALLAHVGLIVALSLNVNWRRQEVAVVSAELWSSLPSMTQQTSPAPPPPTPAPPPAPKPIPRPQPPAPPPKAAPAHEADIATEKKHEKQPPKPDPKKEAAAKEAALLKEKAEKAAAKAEAEAAAAKAEAKAKADAKAKEARAKAAEAREARLIEEQRTKNLDHIRNGGMAGGSATHGAPAVAYSPSAGYAGRVRARIFPNIVYTGRVMGNPTAEVEIGLSPDGTILNTRLMRSSGLSDWDEAVLRAIDRTAQLPLDIDGHIPAKMVLSFDPNKR
ncbi:MAG: cell envelope integrity protein TolA [Leptothrix ochracea]|uniref:cell envelope integrity protein TolA n=1 Tax=Leptothrix ochracea TaxID=735331 RepID=UPI0034E205F7